MPDTLSKRFPFVVTSIILALLLLRIISDKNTLVTIDGDGKGYYAYLPALLINHSFDWKKLNDIKPGYTNDFIVQHNYNNVNKYSPGTALLIAPFFLLAMLISYMGGFPIDGLSPPFQYAILLASVFYLVLGFYFSYKFLRLFRISNKNILLSIILLLFGTNLLYYSLYEPSMSHVYAFCCVSGFVYFFYSYFQNEKHNYFTGGIILFALAVLIRPTHLLLILLIPFLSGGIEKIKIVFSKKIIIKGGLLFTGIVLLQSLFWYLQSGNFFIQPYKDEGFYFTRPEILNVLFSFRKGLFIYTPLLFVSLFGFIYLYKQNKYQVLTLGSYILVIFYILSSWWNWYYGDSFGQRAFIDYYVLFFLPLAMLLENSKPALRYTSICLCLLFTSLNLIQTYQYKNHIIHPDAMNYEKYKAIFLKTGQPYMGSLTGAPELFYTPHGKTVIQKFHPWNTPQKENTERHYLNNEKEFEEILKTKILSVNLGSNPAYIYAQITYNKLFNESANDIFFVVNINDSTGHSYFHKNEKLFSIEKSQGKYSEEFGFRLPATKSGNDELSVYIWNKERKEFSIYDVNLEFWEKAE